MECRELERTAAAVIADHPEILSWTHFYNLFRNRVRGKADKALVKQIGQSIYSEHIHRRAREFFFNEWCDEVRPTFWGK